MYMGKDKYENEDLIRYGVPEDVWFHVDNLSSAHVYLRMNRGEKVMSMQDEEHGPDIFLQGKASKTMSTAPTNACKDRHGSELTVASMIPRLM